MKKEEINKLEITKILKGNWFDEDGMLVIRNGIALKDIPEGMDIFCYDEQAIIEMWLWG